MPSQPAQLHQGNSKKKKKKGGGGGGGVRGEEEKMLERNITEQSSSARESTVVLTLERRGRGSDLGKWGCPLEDRWPSSTFVM